MVVTGPFHYLRFHQIHDVPLCDLVSFEHLTGMEEVEDESDVHHYNVVFGSLTESALDPNESRARITAVAIGAWAGRP